MDKARSRRAAPALVIVVVIVAAYMAWQASHLGGFSYGYDEGVYAESAWLMQSGHGLFSEVFSSQPPLFVSFLAAVFAVTGPSISAARLAIVLFSLLALGGVAVVAWRLSGWLAGLLALVFLAVNPNFVLHSRINEADIPSVSLGTAAVGFAAIYQGSRRRWWLAGSGILFSLALFTKLLVAPVALVLILSILVARFSGDPQERRGAVKKAVLDLALLSVIVALPWISVIALYGLPNPLDQLVTFHLRAQEVYPANLFENFREVAGFTLVDPGLLVLALFGLVMIALKRRLLAFSPVLLWIVGSWLFLLDQAPLFTHHVVAILPPMAVLAGVGLHEGLASLVRLWPIESIELRRYALPAVTGALIVLYLVGVPRLLTLNGRSGSPSKPDEVAASSYLASVTASDRYVVSDEQMIPFAAGRRVPADLTDTSSVRLDTGYLSSRSLIEATEKSDAQAVIFWTGRFQGLSAYVDWVKTHYRLAKSFGDSQAIYLKP